MKLFCLQSPWQLPTLNHCKLQKSLHRVTTPSPPRSKLLAISSIARRHCKTSYRENKLHVTLAFKAIGIGKQPHLLIGKRTACTLCQFKQFQFIFSLVWLGSCSWRLTLAIMFYIKTFWTVPYVWKFSECWIEGKIPGKFITPPPPPTIKRLYGCDTFFWDPCGKMSWNTIQTTIFAQRKSVNFCSEFFKEDSKSKSKQQKTERRLGFRFVSWLFYFLKLFVDILNRKLPWPYFNTFVSFELLDSF